MKIELEPDEVRELRRIGDAALSELRVEVRRTSTPDYRDALVAERQLLTQVVEKLRRYELLASG